MKKELYLTSWKIYVLTRHSLKTDRLVSEAESDLNSLNSNRRHANSHLMVCFRISRALWIGGTPWSVSNKYKDFQGLFMYMLL